MTSKAETRLNTLIKARELISDPAGWNKWDFFNPEYAYEGGTQICSRCAWGALIEADAIAKGVEPSFLPKSEGNAYDAKTFIEKHLLDNDLSLPEFNDRDDIKHEDVLRLFDRAIILARAELERDRHAVVGHHSCERWGREDEDAVNAANEAEADAYNPAPIGYVIALTMAALVLAFGALYLFGGS